MPVFSLQGRHDGIDYALVRPEHPPVGRALPRLRRHKVAGHHFDYNSSCTTWVRRPHAIPPERARRLDMSAYLRQYLGAAVDAVPAASRTYPFYADLLAPTIDAAPYETS